MDRFGNPGAENAGRRQDLAAELAVRDERGRTDYAPAMPEPKPPTKLEAAPAARPLRTAVLLAVGSELTVGETRDTNSGDLARSLAERGVEVDWVSALPDRLATVVDALRDALAAADLVVTTGGLGPTPDDLTREAIAAVFGERPAVDPELERWLRHLFERRGIAFPEANLKQAWLIPSATAIPNDRGTAPGWWVDRPDGRVIVALPGPPSEMRPMWEGWVLPRLRDRGLGQERVTRTYRLAGIGESAVAALLGERLLRAENPVVATYARADAVDVRISARAERGPLAGAARRGGRGRRPGRRRHLRLGPRRRHLARRPGPRAGGARLDGGPGRGRAPAAPRCGSSATPRGSSRRASSRPRNRTRPVAALAEHGPAGGRRDRRAGRAGGRVGRGHAGRARRGGPWGASRGGPDGIPGRQPKAGAGPASRPPPSSMRRSGTAARRRGSGRQACAGRPLSGGQ